MQIFIKIFSFFFITMNIQMLYAEERLVFGADIKKIAQQYEGVLVAVSNIK